MTGSKAITSLIFLWIAHFFMDALIGIWPVYKSLIHLDLAKAGCIAATCALIGEGTQAFFGILSDRGYQKYLIVLGVFAGLANLLLPFTEYFPILFLTYLSTCIGSGAFHPSAVGFISTLSETRKGLFISIFASGGAIGLAFSHLIFSSAYFSFNGNTYLLVMPILCFLGVFLLYKLPRSADNQIVRSKLSLETFKKFFQKKDLRNLYFTQVCLQAISWACIFILPDVLNMKGYPKWIAYGGGHLCFVLGGAILMAPAGYLADRFSAKSVILCSAFTSFLFFYFFLASPLLPTSLLLVNLFILGGTLGIISPLGVALGNQLAPESPGAISAFLMGFVWCVSEFLGPGGVGILATLLKGGPVTALMAIGGFYFIGIFYILRLPKALPAEAEILN